MAELCLPEVKVSEAKPDEREGQTTAQLAWAAWLERLARWETFYTLTSRAPSEGEGVAYTRRGWKWLKARHDEWVERWKFDYFVVLELHETGVPHLHGLARMRRDPKGQDPDEANLKRFREAAKLDADLNIGWSKVDRYDRERGAARYVTKYVTKEMGHWWTNVRGNPRLTRMFD